MLPEIEIMFLRQYTCFQNMVFQSQDVSWIVRIICDMMVLTLKMGSPVYFRYRQAQLETWPLRSQMDFQNSITKIFKRFGVFSRRNKSKTSKFNRKKKKTKPRTDSGTVVSIQAKILKNKTPAHIFVGDVKQRLS